ncbi:Uncharacterised protein [Pseudomonas aeruginosa]|nr:hypothetical protein PAERUG_P15_London_17_VIM_2_02_10_01333 [Pseudomonas aeruginosa]VTQ29094.1 Uncharacterised protein [Pseudomonas aeruginosa]
MPRYTETVKGQRAETAREWGARGKALPRKGEKASRPAPQRTPACSPCSSENGPRSLPRRQRPPPTSRKGCCGPNRPHRCWQHRAGRSCWNTSGSARRCRGGSSPPYTARRWSTTPSWSNNSPHRKAITTLTPAACWITGWRSSPMRSSCGSPICCPLAPVPKTRRRSLKPGLPQSLMPRCCTTSARSPSICTSNWPTARCGTPGTARCTSHTASATATIENIGSTALRQVCSTANSSTVMPWTGSVAIPTCGDRCSTSWPASTSTPACWANLSYRPTALPWPKSWEAIPRALWPPPSTRCNASCWTGCATCSRKS